MISSIMICHKTTTSLPFCAGKYMMVPTWRSNTMMKSMISSPFLFVSRSTSSISSPLPPPLPETILSSPQPTTATTTTTTTATIQNLVGMTREEVISSFDSVQIPKFRADQVWNWMYVKGANSFQEMKNISKEMKSKLEQHFKIDYGIVRNEKISFDGTRKFLLNYSPDEVECVYIPDKSRGTLCISSQVGCTMSCTFCHTGTQKLVCIFF
eukprot:TRINITY_DN3015_c0_g3_i2.p1 TRINITY_DN3015_c0_g3~~TRINITY_DN3015_c0_g3_i2.p1  ORF type:complete len:211 (+),score=59.80 TRINITY_DN3015_c0_g3_i2:81-713(+)